MKITTQHTPGPWKSEGRFIIHGITVVASMSAAFHDEEERANARLIAAAPEMFSWLQKAEQMLNQEGEDEPSGSAWRWLATNITQVLKRAEGREVE